MSWKKHLNFLCILCSCSKSSSDWAVLEVIFKKCTHFFICSKIRPSIIAKTAFFFLFYVSYECMSWLRLTSHRLTGECTAALLLALAAWIIGTPYSSYTTSSITCQNENLIKQIPSEEFLMGLHFSHWRCGVQITHQIKIYPIEASL